MLIKDLLLVDMVAAQELNRLVIHQIWLDVIKNKFSRLLNQKLLVVELKKEVFLVKKPPYNVEKHVNSM